MILKQTSFDRNDLLIAFKQNGKVPGFIRLLELPSSWQRFLNGYYIGCQIANRDTMVVCKGLRMVSISESSVSLYEIYEPDKPESEDPSAVPTV